jgi:eukaryotic-like serine/threonine-protein kinase
VEERVLNGRYRLGEVVGEGGMAVVYRGHDLLLNRPVAIKVLRSQYASDTGFLRRFEREAQAAAGFSHPNIVNVYDVGTDADQHYIVQEYIRGPSLKELIRRQGPFSVDGAVFIISQVASALDYAHQRGLIHRDIKPQNILVDREGNAKVVDFGIAKGMRDMNLTEAGTGMGTVHYVSPEQARGEPAIPESDLYSTGVVLFEMLTKRLPFEADTPVGVAMKHVNEPPPAPSQLNPAIPPEVDAIVRRALAKDPRDRYPSGGQLSAALRHWDLPAIVRPDRVDRTQPVAPGTPPPAAPRPRSAAVPPTARAGVRDPGPPVGGTSQFPPRGSGGGGARAVPPGAAMPPPQQPPRTAARPAAAYDAGDRGYRDDVGCVTWLIGSAILIGIVGVIVLAFKLGPGAFSSGTDDPTATTQGNIPAATGTATTMPDPDATPTPTGQATATGAASETTGTVSATATVPASATGTQEPPTATATTGVSTADVPSLVGGTVADAQSAVGDFWSLDIVEQASDNVAEGFIISQTPAAGASLAEGETVTVVVSTGPELVSIPDVRGLDVDTAEATLVDLGFVVTTTEETNGDYAEGTVIRTQPSTSAPFGSTVTMVVSLGNTTTVPDVYGYYIDDAQALVEDAGLTVGDVSGLPCAVILVTVDPNFDCNSFTDGGVISQSLSAHSTVEIGARIDLIYYDPFL